jgi:protein-S-isoprenylcysteine O-methyltransferase Ste14
MTLIGKWIDLIYKVATGSWKIKLIFAPIAGLLYLGLIGLFIFLSFVFDRSMQFPDIFNFPWNIIISVPIIVIGFLLMSLSVFYFLKVRGTPVPFSPPPKLVKTGPYKHVRNPMLTGLFIQLFGFGFIFNSLSLIVIFTPLFIIVNVWELKRIEEPELKKRFGKEYLDYKKQVPMFFPIFKIK